MLNFLILLILMFSLVTALFNGKIDFLCNQLLDSPQKAVELTITVGCSICLWSGVMEVARQSGLLRFLSKFFSPILSLLFPGMENPRIHHEIAGMLIAAFVKKRSSDHETSALPVQSIDQRAG